MVTSRSRHLVCSTQSEARNSSADENERAVKPNSLSKSGSDSRTDSSSSTTDTTDLGIVLGSSSRIRCASLSRNGKRKSGARTVVRLRPKTPMMALNDGTTDGKPDSHAVVLGCIKGLKKPVHSLGIEADARVLYREPHLIVCASLRSDLQLPGTIVHGAHRVRGVLEPIRGH